MWLTILGGCGAWPTAAQPCSGYLVEHDGFRALIDPGYATLPRLLEIAGAGEIDAVLVSHGHPDQCADLNPLLRARALADEPAPPLPVHAPPGALDQVLALDRPGMLDDAISLRESTPGERFTVGPFRARSWLLPHFTPNAGLRLETTGACLAYTGDTGPSPSLLPLAENADVFLAEATYPDRVPYDDAVLVRGTTPRTPRIPRCGARRRIARPEGRRPSRIARSRCKPRWRLTPRQPT